MTLEQLCDEFKRENIGPLIYAELWAIARRVVSRYDPKVYAGAAAWDSALDDLVQEVVLERLLGEGQLSYAMTVAGDLLHWRRLMERQIRRTLAHRRQRTVVDNLLDRAAAILEHAPFESSRSGRLTEHRLAGRSVVSRRPTEEELRMATIEAVRVPITVGQGNERAPMVYSTAALAALLERVAGSLPTTFTKNDLDRILRDLLTQWLASNLVDIEGVLQLPSESLTPESDVVVNDAVNSLLASMTAQERQILRAKLAGMSDQEVADEIGLSRPTIAQRKATVFDRVGAALEGLSQAMADAVVARLDAALNEARWNES